MQNFHKDLYNIVKITRSYILPSPQSPRVPMGSSSPSGGRQFVPQASPSSPLNPKETMPPIFNTPKLGEEGEMYITCRDLTPDIFPVICASLNLFTC